MYKGSCLTRRLKVDIMVFIFSLVQIANFFADVEKEGRIEDFRKEQRCEIAVIYRSREGVD